MKHIYEPLAFLHQLNKTGFVTLQSRQTFAALSKIFSNIRNMVQATKRVSHLCYCWFRLSAVLKEPTEENILMALFLCSNESNEVLAQLAPEWNENVHVSLPNKMALLQYLYCTGNLSM